SEQAAYCVERMHDAATRMRSLIDDLLSLSRIMAKGESFETVELNELIDDLLLDLREQIAEEDASVRRESLPTVHGDRSQLYRLFQNLVGNSLKYRRPSVPAEV